MSIQLSDDAMLPLKEQRDPRPARLKPAVFVPIAIALIGVFVILFGGLPARDLATAISKAEQVDPLVTGAVRPTSFADMSPAEQRRALEMLDR